MCSHNLLSTNNCTYYCIFYTVYSFFVEKILTMFYMSFIRMFLKIEINHCWCIRINLSSTRKKNKERKNDGASHKPAFILNSFEARKCSSVAIPLGGGQ